MSFGFRLGSHFKGLTPINTQLDLPLHIHPSPTIPGGHSSHSMTFSGELRQRTPVKQGFLKSSTNFQSFLLCVVINMNSVTYLNKLTWHEGCIISTCLRTDHHSTPVRSRAARLDTAHTWSHSQKSIMKHYFSPWRCTLSRRSRGWGSRGRCWYTPRRFRSCLEMSVQIETTRS